METRILLRNTIRISGKFKIGLRYLVLLGISVVLFAPFVLSFLGTLKTNAEIIAWPPKIFPENWLWNNWADTWNTDLGRGGTFPRWLFNTSFLAIVTATLQVLFCAMGGYAFARLKFKGKNIIFTFMLSSMMLPGIVTLVPKYVFMAKIHLINTYWALILPGSVEAFGIFLLTQYFKSIPGELEEACKIDGASYLDIFRNVIIPLSKPALLTLFILKFQAMWNNFMEALLYLSKVSMWTLNVALMTFQQQYVSQRNLVLVGVMFNAFPVLILFFLFSKYYMEGVSFSGLKG
ncbi:MAG: carbohydrate ABC transporter permease [Spirochaetales bacterium]|jgi:multiple sugar transport system permease protein|nr:carbohydrate ABC transporter permease [Spirochaetales bacterium]